MVGEGLSPKLPPPPKTSPIWLLLSDSAAEARLFSRFASGSCSPAKYTKLRMVWQQNMRIMLRPFGGFAHRTSPPGALPLDPASVSQTPCAPLPRNPVETTRDVNSRVSTTDDGNTSRPTGRHVITLRRVARIVDTAPHSRRNRVYETVGCPSVRPSVPSFARRTSAAERSAGKKYRSLSGA